MLKITLQGSAGDLRFRLEGRLCGPWVAELRRSWAAAISNIPARPPVVDLREVDFVDAEGAALLGEMHGAGADLVAETPLIRALVEEIAHPRQCATVEGKSALGPHAFLRSDTAGRDPRAV